MAIIASASTGAMTLQVAHVPAATPVKDVDAAAQFASLMSLPLDAKTPAPVNVPAPEPAAKSTNLLTMGDAILHQLQAVGSDYQMTARAASAALKDISKHSMSDMLSLQMALSIHSVELDVIGKVVSKGVQHIDTLTKLQ